MAGRFCPQVVPGGPVFTGQVHSGPSWEMSAGSGGEGLGKEGE